MTCTAMKRGAMFSADEVASMRQSLIDWYRRDGRNLPWRDDSADPYRIVVSEMMLVQTTVTAVIPYYMRFLDRFPTVIDLAAADVSDVLKMWEGLGYYRRAHQLHRMAQTVVSEHGGRFPSDERQLLALPGIGRYIAVQCVRSLSINLHRFLKRIRFGCMQGSRLPAKTSPKRVSRKSYGNRPGCWLTHTIPAFLIRPLWIWGP